MTNSMIIFVNTNKNHGDKMKPFQRFRLFSNTIFISLVVVFTGLYANTATGEKINSIVAIVNDEIVTNFDVLRRTAIAIREAESKYNEAALDEKKVEFYEEALNELINRKVLIQTAQEALRKDEIKMDEIEKDLDAFIKGAAKEVGSLSRFYEIVSEQGIDPLGKKRELKDDLMVEKILKENVYKKISVKPKDTKNYYNTHKDEFYKDRQTSFRQILIKISEFENKELARNDAQNLMNRLSKGEDFAELAKNHSQDSHASKGGLWTFEEVSEVRKDLKEIIFGLEKGQVSGIIESDIGFHIIKCEENIPPSYLPFKEAQDEIYQKLFREKFGDKKNEYLEQLKKGFFIHKY